MLEGLPHNRARKSRDKINLEKSTFIPTEHLLEIRPGAQGYPCFNQATNASPSGSYLASRRPDRKAHRSRLLRLKYCKCAGV